MTISLEKQLRNLRLLRIGERRVGRELRVHVTELVDDVRMSNDGRD